MKIKISSCSSLFCCLLQLVLLLLVVFINFSYSSPSSPSSLFSTQESLQVIVENPTDQQAKIGEQVLLKCKFKNLRGEPQWCIDDFCLGISKRDASSSSSSSSSSSNSINNSKNSSSSSNSFVLKGRPRHRIIGNKSKGEFHLLIDPVQLQDNMYYYCMATAASETIKAVKSKKAFLTVLTYPKSLSLESPIHVSLNKPSTIQCVAKQSRPPVRIFMAVNGQLITDESRYRTEIVQIPVDQAATSINQNENSSMQQPSTANTYLSPSVSIPVEQMRHSFYDTITNLTLDDISMKMQGQLIECFAYSFLNLNPKLNHKSQSSSSFSHNIGNLNLNSFQSNVMNTKSIIQVDYAPEVNLRIVSSSRILKEEDVVSLVCEARATPAIHSYKWYIGKNHLQGVTDSNLNLKLRREMHLQSVTCEAANSVASVKASIQLNIIFKPSFIRGPKSYVLVNKNACNRPLTLDCQVNSNPGANITWFRRRKLNNKRSFNFHRKKYLSLFSSFDLEKLSKAFSFSTSNNVIENDDYEDEMIGSGPTYTIAALNCGHLLDNLRNRTSQRSSSSSKHAHGDKTRPTRLSKYLMIDSNNNNNNKNETTKQQQSANFSQTAGMRYKRSQHKRMLTRRVQMREAADYEIDAEYAYQVQNGENQDHLDQVEVEMEATDFGVYLCVAKNNYAYDAGVDLTTVDEQHQTSRRFIKLNPNGAPIVRILQTTKSVQNLDDSHLYFNAPTSSWSSSASYQRMLTSISTAEHEVTNTVGVKIGSSISLTCLIEPVPEFHTIYWLKEDGKIIPNSKYTSLGGDSSVEFNGLHNSEQQQPLDTIGYSISDDGDNNKQQQDHHDHRDPSFTNFKIKYENMSSMSFGSGGDENKQQQQHQSKHAHLSGQQHLTTDGIVQIDSVGLMRSILYIRNVRHQDIGVYRCKAINSYGSRAVSIVLREKTFIDNFNISNTFSFIILIGLLVVLSLTLVLLFVCLVSKRLRSALCCCFCCCFSSKYGKYKSEKEKELARNLNCELNSDKTINEWLASSKMSSDTTNGSIIINPHETTSTNNTSNTTINNSLEMAAKTIKLANGLIANKKEYNGAGNLKTRVLKHELSIQHAHHHHRKKLLNSDEFESSPTTSTNSNNDDDEYDDGDCMKDDENRENEYDNNNGMSKCNRYKVNDDDDNTATNTDEEEENENASLNGGEGEEEEESDEQSDCIKRLIEHQKANNDYGGGLNMESFGQFGRYLTSTSLINNNSQNNNSQNGKDIYDYVKNNGKLNNNIKANATTVLKSSLPMVPPPMTIIKSHNFSNGNFNAKISAAATVAVDPTVNNTLRIAPTLTTGSLTRKHSLLNGNSSLLPLQDFNRSLKRRENDTIDDLNRMLQDTTSRLSDMFNELTSTNTNKDTNDAQQSSTFLSSNHHHNNHFARYPNYQPQQQQHQTMKPHHNPMMLNQSENENELNNSLNSLSTLLKQQNHHHQQQQQQQSSNFLMNCNTNTLRNHPSSNAIQQQQQQQQVGKFSLTPLSTPPVQHVSFSNNVTYDENKNKNNSLKLNRFNSNQNKLMGNNDSSITTITTATPLSSAASCSTASTSSSLSSSTPATNNNNKYSSSGSTFIEACTSSSSATSSTSTTTSSSSASNAEKNSNLVVRNYPIAKITTCTLNGKTKNSYQTNV